MNELPYDLEDRKLGWVTHYDGPGRRLRLVHAPGRWQLLQVCPELAHPLVRVLRRAEDARAPMLGLDVELDEYGTPRAWLANLEWGVLGSPTLWPKPELQYTWRNAVLRTVDGRDVLEVAAPELGPVELRPHGHDPDWPLGFRHDPRIAELGLEDPDELVSASSSSSSWRDELAQLGVDERRAYVALAGEGEAIRAYDDPTRGLWVLFAGDVVELPGDEFVGGGWVRTFAAPEERERFLQQRYGNALRLWREHQQRR